MSITFMLFIYSNTHLQRGNPHIQRNYNSYKQRPGSAPNSHKSMWNNRDNNNNNLSNLSMHKNNTPSVNNNNNNTSSHRYNLFSS